MSNVKKPEYLTLDALTTLFTASSVIGCLFLNFLIYFIVSKVVTNFTNIICN